MGIILCGKDAEVSTAAPYRGDAFAAVNAAGDAANRIGTAMNAYSAATTSGSASLSGWTRRLSISLGQTCQNWPRRRSQSERIPPDHLLPVACPCSALKIGRESCRERVCPTV